MKLLNIIHTISIIVAFILGFLGFFLMLSETFKIMIIGGTMFFTALGIVLIWQYVRENYEVEF